MAAEQLVVRRSVIVERSVEEAFRVFTERMASWWPVDSHSIHGAEATPVLEGRAGGRVYERTPDGREAPWGSVLVWEPPHRLVLAWRVNPRWPAPTEVEVRFAAVGDATRVELEHRGFERVGEGAAESARSYDEGWGLVLGRFAAAASR